jgi:hypothetical protein
VSRSFVNAKMSVNSAEWWINSWDLHGRNMVGYTLFITTGYAKRTATKIYLFS